MITELDRRLTDLRLAPHWPTDERAVILDEVLRTDPAPQRADVRLISSGPRHGRRAVVVTAVAGLAAAACITVPAVLPAGSPGSADQAAAVQALHHLARVAAVSPSDDLGPDQYLHVVDVDHQNALAGQPASDSRFEDWIKADGQTYQRRSESVDGGPTQEEVWLLPPGPQVIDGMTAPVYLDDLPTDPDALEAYVQAHTTGSTSTDERVFVAVNDIVRRGLASSALRSAAIEILARLGHVQLGDETHDSRGNPVEAFDFVDPDGRPDDVRTVMFDTRTAQITEELEHFHGDSVLTRTVPVFEVVDAVPASVTADAIPQK